MEYNKRIATIGEFTRYYFQSAFSMFNLIFRDKKVIDNSFFERIMLAVTEVNGCQVCSQVHAKIALESGLSDEEITKLLSNDKSMIPENQAVGVMFATHYADSKGKPDKSALNRLYKEYKRKDAKAILACCKMMMPNNTIGIAVDTFKQKFKKDKNKAKSSLFRELYIFLSTIIMSPLYIVVMILGGIFNH